MRTPHRVVYQHDLASEVRSARIRVFTAPPTAYEVLHHVIWRINTRSAARGWVVVLDADGAVLEGWPRHRWRQFYDPRDVPALETR